MEMTPDKGFEGKQANVDFQVARLLRVGSALAATLIAVGLLGMLAGVGSDLATSLTNAGLVVLVLTPVLRVVVALLVYLREGDYTFVLISFTVLCALTAGLFLGQTH